MVCEHLRQLYQLCLDQKIRLGGSDLIHIVCGQCGHKDLCPSNLRDDTAEPADSAPNGARFDGPRPVRPG
jgi:hypothetical protein